MTLCGCSNNGLGSPLGDAEIGQSQSKMIRIYVCGAVEREGYYEVKVGTSYFELLQSAGLLYGTSVLPPFSSSYVDGRITKIIVGYYDGENEHDSINANSPLISARLTVDGLSAEVVNKLADYVNEYGKFVNKQQLEVALGNDYGDNYYKLFVAESDYEQAD